MANDFQVGDYVTYNNDPKFIGVVLKVYKDKYLIDFSATGVDSNYSKGYNFGTHSYLKKEITLPYKIFSKEERVCNKIKTLWNSSKYVKKNPHLAY